MISIRVLINSLILVLVTILLSINPNIVNAVDYTETFNNALTNPSFWQTSRGNLIFSTDSLDREFASMEVVNGVNPFNYLKSTNFVTIKPDYSSIFLTVKFSPDGITQGAGYILSDNIPSESSSLLFSTYMFYVWPKPNGTFHLFSSLCPESNSSCNIGSQLANGVFAMPTDNNWHNIEIKRSFSQYEWLVDGLSVFKTVITPRNISGIGIGDPENTTGFQVWPKLYMDFIGLDTPVVPPISFPHLSQKDTEWASEVYDRANEWAGLDKTGIDRWGCALTSAAMVLQEYGVKDLDGGDMEPDWLNTWLKAQSDGYICPGYVNWLAIARYAKGRATGGKSLEFERSYDPSSVELPAILGLTGHFVVAHGEDLINWKINDPNLSAGNTDLVKTTTIKSINRYVLSSTDLSYMLLVAKPGMTITMRDGANTIMPLNWVEEYLSDDVDGGAPSPTLLTAMVPKPVGGDYRIEVENATEPAQLGLYLYDRGGAVEQANLESPSGSITYLLQYDRENVGDSDVTVADTTPPTSTFVLPALSNNWDGEIEGTATDSASGVAKVELIIKHPSGLEQTVTADGTTEWSYTIPTLVDGTYWIQSRASDVEGNIETPAAAHKLVRDTKPPAKPNFVLSHNFLQRIWINWRPVNSARKYRIYYGNTREEMNNMVEITTPQWLSGVVDPGNYHLGVKAIDGAGNESAMSTIVKIKVIRLPLWLR